MEVQNSHQTAYSGTGKRKRLDSEDHDNVFHFRSRRHFDDNLSENFVSTTVSGSYDHVSNHDSITDLKIDFVSSNYEDDDFSEEISDESSPRSLINLKSEEIDVSHKSSNNSEEMKSLSNATSKKNSVTSQATSMPCAAELDDFFSKAEKYQQKRFEEKYNYDIVKDVPIEGGRYKWIQL